MTRRVLLFWVADALNFYASCLVLAALTFPDTARFHSVYTLLKDFQGPLAAPPAAWLAWCFQRRNSYLQQLRALWSATVAAVQGAIQYTYASDPTQVEYGVVLKELSTVNDEYRGSFKYLREEPDGTGYYPFESLKRIHAAVSALEYGGSFKKNQCQATRKAIVDHWQQAQRPFLKELDRARPTYFDTPYVRGSFRRVSDHGTLHPDDAHARG